MWFEMLFDNSGILMIIILLVHRNFPMVSIFDQR